MFYRMFTRLLIAYTYRYSKALIQKIKNIYEQVLYIL